MDLGFCRLLCFMTPRPSHHVRELFRVLVQLHQLVPLVRGGGVARRLLVCTASEARRVSHGQPTCYSMTGICRGFCLFLCFSICWLNCLGFTHMHTHIFFFLNVEAEKGEMEAMEKMYFACFSLQHSNLTCCVTEL